MWNAKRAKMGEEDEAMLRLLDNKEDGHVLPERKGKNSEKEEAGSKSKSAALDRLQQAVHQIVGQLLVEYDGETWTFGGCSVSSYNRRMLEMQMPNILQSITRRFTKEQVLVCVFRFPRLWQKFFVE